MNGLTRDEDSFRGNIARDNARVGIQTEAVHLNIVYQAPPDATPEKRFEIGVACLDAGLPDKAREHIEDAVARGYENNQVRFYWLLALLSARTLRQLGKEDVAQLRSICDRVTWRDTQDEWTAGLRVIVSLLGSPAAADPEVLLKQLDQLPPRQRDLIVGHLGALLEGSMVDQMWQLSVDRAKAGREAWNRRERLWKFFEPPPAGPRAAPVRPAAISAGDWLRLALGTAGFLFAVGKLAPLAGQRGTLAPWFDLLLLGLGLVAFAVAGAEWRFRTERRQAKEAQFVPSRHRRRPPAGGFASGVDQLFDRYFARYVPAGTDRDVWLEGTAGIRQRLRDELVEIYREQRVYADQLAWLVRHLVGRVRRQWENGSLTAYVHELRTPWWVKLACGGGLVTATAGGLRVAGRAVSASPLPGLAWTVLAVVGAIYDVWAWLYISTERRRERADALERAHELAGRRLRHFLWERKLSDRPSDPLVAFWFDCDRRVILDEVMRSCGLRPSQVIAHACLASPAQSYKRARVLDGPWRYSRYRLLLFLLTDDGVRQVDVDLDFVNGTHRVMGRHNYRFDAVAAVRVDGLASSRQTFQLTLVDGNPIEVTVTEVALGDTQLLDDTLVDDDLQLLAERYLDGGVGLDSEAPSDAMISDGDGRDGEILGVPSTVALDASGLTNTLAILEGIAAEGKEWVKRQRQRTEERLEEVASAVRRLMD
jgi:membrane protein implicated in regulation of membrane protease activity